MINLKNNKGAITLYILVSLLFFIIAIASVQANLKTKEASVESEYQKIKASYEKNAGEVYDSKYKKVTVESLIESGKPVNTNTPVEDAYGNTLIVPAGFKITTDADTVPEGIVIEDVSAGNVTDETTGETTNPTLGSQFVWIPVGDVYTTTDKEKTSENTEVVTLGRYSWSGSTGTPVQTVTTEEEAISAATATIAADSGYYEVTADNGTYGTSKGYTNAKAKDLAGFLKSAVKNGGYYIARYEAGIDGEKDNYTLSQESAATAITVKPQSKQGLGVWNSIKQTDASTVSQAMYTNSNFTSDLINSYAWDTAIIFIQKMSGKDDYACQSSFNSGSPTTTGTSGDVEFNIYDMASNVREYSTETSSNSNSPCVSRGGSYGSSDFSTRTRYGYFSGITNKNYGFRPILYVGLDSNSETTE